MILREYRCAKCGITVEARISPADCNNCGSKSMTKVLSAPRTLNFKGKGFEHNGK